MSHLLGLFSLKFYQIMTMTLFQAGKSFSRKKICNYLLPGLCERIYCLSLLCIILEENSNDSC